MRFRLDENADPRWRGPLEQAGHSVSTVVEEHLRGSQDSVIAETCENLGMCLITADLGVAQILEYPPDRYPGIVVLRHPAPTLAEMTQLILQIVTAVKTQSPEGHLWIVEPNRIRIHGASVDKDS